MKFDVSQYTSEEYQLLKEMLEDEYKKLINRLAPSLDNATPSEFLVFIGNMSKVDPMTYSVMQNYNDDEIPKFLHGIDRPIEEMPLQINSPHILDVVVTKWRFRIGH